MSDSRFFDSVEHQREQTRLLEELDGRVELGDRTEALRTCRLLLKTAPISGDVLRAVVRAIAMHGTRKAWVKPLEATYLRHSKKRRRELDGSMLMFYVAFNDWGNAIRFADARKGWQPDEAAFAMDTLIHYSRVNQAKRLYGVCLAQIGQILPPKWNGQALPEATDLAFGFLAYALASYDAKVGRTGLALAQWEYVSPEHPLGFIALFRRIDFYLRRSMELVTIGLERVNRQRREDPTMLSLPHNHDALMTEHQKLLQKRLRTVEQLVNENRRRGLGFGGHSEVEA